jgi:hypothetical protein
MESYDGPRYLIEFAVENFPNNTSQPAPREDHFLWEDGARRAAGEVAMDEILLSDEGGLETGGSRLFVGNLTIHSSEASRDHPDFAWWPTSKPAGHATYSELDFVGQNEADHQGQIGPAGDLSVVGEVSVPRLVDQASSFDL